VPLYGGLTWGEGGYQVFEDAVGDGLMESALIAEAPQIEFEAFQLYAERVRHIAYAKASKVRLSRQRAQARKLRALENNFIVPMGGGVREAVQIFRR